MNFLTDGFGRRRGLGCPGFAQRQSQIALQCIENNHRQLVAIFVKLGLLPGAIQSQRLG